MSGIGIGLSPVLGSVSVVQVDSEAAAIIAAMVPTPDATRQALINTLVSGLKSDFSVNNMSSIFDIFYMMAAHSAQAAGLNWVNPATFALSPQNSPTFATDRGYTGNGTTSYLNTGWTPSVNGVRYTLNNASFGVYVRTNVENADEVDIGAISGANVTYIVSKNHGSATMSYGINRNGASLGSAANSMGLSVANRSANGTAQCYRNAVNIGDDVSDATALVSQPFYVCGWNNAGTPGSFSTRQCALAFAGRSMTADEHVFLFDRVEAFLDAIGAGIA